MVTATQMATTISRARALSNELSVRVVQNERQPQQPPTNTIPAKPMTMVFRHPTGVGDAP